MAQLSFNAAAVAPASPMSPLTPGKYRVIAVESEMKPTKSGNGAYLQFVFQVLDGEYKGRKLWERLNLQNPSKVAEEIAHRALSAFCRSAGVMQLTDSVQLHNKPIVVEVGVEVDKATGKPSNRVTGYYNINGEAPPADVMPSSGGEQQQAAHAEPLFGGSPVSSAAPSGKPVWK